MGPGRASVVTLPLVALLTVAVVRATGGALEKGDEGCSQVCQCHYIDDNLSVHCVRLNLTSPPSDIPLNVTILDLSMNNIGLLGPTTFKASLPLLQRLDLRMNGLTDIKTGALQGLIHLRELGLDHNELMHLRAGMFSDLASLAVLSMNSNKIASIENGTFGGLVLKHLNMHDNNPLQIFDAGLFTGAKVESLSLDRCSLTSIHVDTFMPLADSLKNLFWSHNLRALHLPARLLQGLDLATLWLSDNQMTDFHFLSHTKALHLDLSNNPIGEMDLGVYLAMEHVEFFNLSQTQLKKIMISGGRIMFNLQELDISDNFLRNIDSTLFQRMPSLTRLDVSGNQLHYIGAALHLILYQLEFWDLTGNRLLCDCRLEWFRRWASNQNKTHLQGAVCGLPRLTPVIGSPEFTCSPPTILRISSDAVEHTWHLQCDAEGWPTPRITWSYNISRHQSVRVEERWIAFHGHPFRNSSMLIITANHQLPVEFCFHFVCAAVNSEGSDKTEYVHCAERAPSPPGGGGYAPPSSADKSPPVLAPVRAASLEELRGVQGAEGAKKGKGQGGRSAAGDQNSSMLAAHRRSVAQGDPTPLSGFSVSVGLSSAALICLLLLGLLGAVLYSRRRGDRLIPRPGAWEQPDSTPGEGLTDSTKCLVEHNESADKATFSIDTV